VAHEFGHYMNEVYSGGKYSQSYDLLEMHSQGNELVFLAYLKGQLGGEDCAIIEVKQLIDMMTTIATALAVDTFEQSVYLNSIDYYGDAPMSAVAESIMADGTITADEYDALFRDIIKDLGVSSINPTYWRYVTIGSPCYYISYSISAISVLQLYPKALEDFDAAKDSYLKLFTYVDEYGTGDEYEYMTTEQTLEYAGLYGFTDEELYKYVYEHLITLFE
jgi:oligoendopeptidase F